MPGLVQNGRKRPSVTLSDDDEEEQSDYPSSVSVRSKRARHARDASESPVRANGHRRHDRQRTQNGSASAMQEEDEFQPGSIVRVKLKNFVTYTAAEFHLGPSLNMIIGPNGTGKSTLVCAICLGLGWASELLGRPKEPKEPKELASFVKNGSEEAEIEIELAAGQGMESNPVVRRMIRKPDNKSIFWINGRHVGKNAVSALCKQFSIQIDNLCQFLPQDRVTAFAEMTDVLRLKETLRAAAPKQMVEWHDQLKQLRSEERGLETEQQYKKGLLEGLEKQQNASRDDVERWHQREGLLQKSKCLKKAKPMIELVLFKKDCVQAKKDLQTARRELDQINADVEPVRQAQDEVEAYKIQIEQVMKLRKNRVDSIKSVADRLFANIGKGKDKVADYVSQVNGQANARRERERDIARITAEIQRLERQQQDQPVDYDAESFERRKAELGAQIRVANGRLVECESTYTALKNSVRELNQENRTVREQRARLDTQIGKQASVLSKLSQDTAKAWDWFQKNRDGLSLKGDVLGPPILECSIRDPQYADAVESQLRKGDLVAITCTNADDQKLLSNQFLGRDKMNLHDIYTRTSPKPLSAYRAPVAPSEMQDMGFEGYLIDYVQGPDAVLAMLCDNARLNRTAYASRPISDDQHAAVSSSHIQKWVSGRDVYQITTRREYGASSTAVTQLKKARFFVDQPANSEEKRQLEETIKRIQRESMELQGQIDKCKQEMGDLKQQIHAFKQEKDGVQAEQDQIKKAIAEWQALPRKIQFKQDERESFVAQVAQTSSDIRKIKAQSRQASLNVATTTIEYARTVTQLRTLHELLVEAEIRSIEARSEFNALKKENQDILQKQQRKLAEIQDLAKRKETLRSEYHRLYETTQEGLSSLTQAEEKMVKEYRQLPSLEALELEVQAVAARLEMMAEGNPSLIKDYEQREENITIIRGKLEELTMSLESTKEKIMEIREQWEPQLDALVRKISDDFAHNFQQIGCAGEVTVHKDEEDFDKWSIQISVRFREGETLAVLNARRQSGGERAVATAFYLMALQDFAQSPFRVVDEINQGMDARNERMVYGRMVDIACQERTSQYFLVTPKLLTGLKFHPKMKIHVINSGEHVPDAQEVHGNWNMRDFAKIALRTRKGVQVS